MSIHSLIRQTTDSPPPEKLHSFFQAIETEDESVFLEASENGLFTELAPEWARMAGPENTQHRTHDFTLDVHTAKVVTKTRMAKGFKALSPHWQRLTTLAAFFHDIHKLGGPAHMRMELSPDPLHPIKGGAPVRRYLPLWGFSNLDAFIVSELIRYHQIFGRMIIKQTKFNQPPTAEDYQDYAMLFPEPLFLDALFPLTEGDIRSVKAHDSIFDDDVERKLTQHVNATQDSILRYRSQQTLSHLDFFQDPSTCIEMLPIDFLENHLSVTDCPCGMEAISQQLAYAAQLGEMPSQYVGLRCFIQQVEAGSNRLFISNPIELARP